MKISDVARNSGVGVETVRFYERKGLVPRPRRPFSGYRNYNEDAAKRIRFIRRAQELGFSLAEVRQLLALRTDANVNCADVRATTEVKITEIDRKISSLRSMRNALVELARICPGTGPLDDCPILGAIERAESKSRRRTK
ncbi:MAG TPA: heavy metal-responsive transcriptional regulator [Thermoanaerobaculia bacterium]|jgi:MerR family mercuric resistance operon transcriptional regulator|nr:heavy metal-responsive transcriptional regulator [Thermoanaerobaculia bacterium]